MKACWFEVDGDTYHATKDYPWFVTTGVCYAKNYPSEASKLFYFDSKGVLQKNYAGPAVYNGTTYFFKNGMLFSPTTSNYGLVEGSDGYYYFLKGGGKVLLPSEGTTVKQWVGVANDGIDWRQGLVTDKKDYYFDSQGRMSTSLINKDKAIDVTNTPVDKDNINVTGRVINVTVTENDTSIACKVVYQIGNTYVSVEANKTDLGYSFATEVGASSIQFVVTGDASGDGTIDDKDVTDIKNVVLEAANTISEVGKLAGDVNGDGKVTALDLALINAAAKDKIKFTW